MVEAEGGRSPTFNFSSPYLKVLTNGIFRSRLAFKVTELDDVNSVGDDYENDAANIQHNSFGLCSRRSAI
jgi:hypothetical protein